MKVKLPIYPASPILLKKKDPFEALDIHKDGSIK